MDEFYTFFKTLYETLGAATPPIRLIADYRHGGKDYHKAFEIMADDMFLAAGAVMRLLSEQCFEVSAIFYVPGSYSMAELMEIAESGKLRDESVKPLPVYVSMDELVRFKEGHSNGKSI